eukprot:6190066-Pleurochrysis_carterae.AAC.2
MEAETESARALERAKVAPAQILASVVALEVPSEQALVSAAWRTGHIPAAEEEADTATAGVATGFRASMVVAVATVAAGESGSLDDGRIDAGAGAGADADGADADGADADADAGGVVLDARADSVATPCDDDDDHDDGHTDRAAAPPLGNADAEPDRSTLAQNAHGAYTHRLQEENPCRGGANRRNRAKSLLHLNACNSVPTRLLPIAGFRHFPVNFAT